MNIINHILDIKALKKIYRDDFISVDASPVWKPKPGHGQTWRHTCKLCGEILADDTYVYDLDDSVWLKYINQHLKSHH